MMEYVATTPKRDSSGKMTRVYHPDRSNSMELITPRKAGNLVLRTTISNLIVETEVHELITLTEPLDAVTKTNAKPYGLQKRNVLIRSVRPYVLSHGLSVVIGR